MDFLLSVFTNPCNASIDKISIFISISMNDFSFRLIFSFVFHSVTVKLPPCNALIRRILTHILLFNLNSIFESHCGVCVYVHPLELFGFVITPLSFCIICQLIFTDSLNMNKNALFSRYRLPVMAEVCITEIQISKFTTRNSMVWKISIFNFSCETEIPRKTNFITRKGPS